MAKSATDRLDATLDYIKENLSPANHTEIDRLVKAHVDRNALSANLSIGHKNPFRKKARHAKRALMLMAQLFIQNGDMKRNETARIKRLSEGSSDDLLAELKSWFTIPAVTEAMVAQHARNTIDKMPKWNNVNYDAPYAVRGVYDKARSFNCYNACVFWAFQAGAISKRYLFNKLYQKNGNEFFPIYSQVGWNTILEYRGRPPELIRDDSNGGEFDVPAGKTVYFVTPTKVFGHVACSLGDGTVISQNSVIPAKFGSVSKKWKTEVDKMTRAITHIISIREMVKIHFHPENAYPKVQVTRDPFWGPIPPSER
jgi:hypothetical protein